MEALPGAMSGQRERAGVGPHYGMSVERTFRDERLELRRREREPRRRLTTQPTQDLDILGRRRHIARKVDTPSSAHLGELIPFVDETGSLEGPLNFVTITPSS